MSTAFGHKSQVLRLFFRSHCGLFMESRMSDPKTDHPEKSGHPQVQSHDFTVRLEGQNISTRLSNLVSTFHLVPLEDGNPVGASTNRHFRVTETASERGQVKGGFIMLQ